MVDELFCITRIASSFCMPTIFSIRSLQGPLNAPAPVLRSPAWMYGKSVVSKVKFWTSISSKVCGLRRISGIRKMLRSNFCNFCCDDADQKQLHFVGQQVPRVAAWIQWCPDQPKRTSRKYSTVFHLCANIIKRAVMQIDKVSSRTPTTQLDSKGANRLVILHGSGWASLEKESMKKDPNLDKTDLCSTCRTALNNDRPHSCTQYLPVLLLPKTRY